MHRIGARAERKVTQELVSEFRKVAGKETLLFRLAEAAIARPDDTVRAVVYPVAGEKTLRDLVAEYKSSGPAYRRTVQTTLRASYTGLRKEMRAELGALHDALPRLDWLQIAERREGNIKLTRWTPLPSRATCGC